MAYPDCSRKIAHLNSVITLDVAKAAVFGATAETPLVVDLDVTGIVMTATLRRIAPMGSCQLVCAIWGGRRSACRGVGGTMATFFHRLSPSAVYYPVRAYSHRHSPHAPTPFHLLRNRSFDLDPFRCVWLLNCDFFAKFGERLYLCRRKTDAVVAQLVEHQLPKLRVASSNLVYRSP